MGHVVGVVGIVLQSFILRHLQWTFEFIDHVCSSGIGLQGC